MSAPPSWPPPILTAGWLWPGFAVRSQYQVRQVALPAARQLLLLTPADPAALDLMGQALLLLDDPLNAERFFRRAIQSDAGYSPAHLHLAQVYLLRSATVSRPAGAVPGNRPVPRLCRGRICPAIIGNIFPMKP